MPISDTPLSFRVLIGGKNPDTKVFPGTNSADFVTLASFVLIGQQGESSDSMASANHMVLTMDKRKFTLDIQQQIK